MNIEVRRQGKRTKYYLAHSYREGAEVRKIRRYLGADLTQQQVKKLRKRAEELIKRQIKDLKQLIDPLKYELTEKELSLLKQGESKRTIKITHLSEKEWQKFTDLFTYNTNAIEGSEIIEEEVKEILEKNVWPKEKRKEDIAETYGVAAAIKYIRETKEHLSLQLIKKLHEVVFKNSKTFAGKFREQGVEVGVRDSVGNILHVGAPSEKIQQLLRELVRWYRKHKKRYPPLLLAAVVHNQFENIHPFQDGNGRVGRLLLNNILLKHRLSPVNIELKHRAEYYQTLQEYQNKGDIRPTLNLLLKEYRALKKELGDHSKRKM